MMFKKLWRALRGQVDREELARQVTPFVAPDTSEVARYENKDRKELKEIQNHIDEANSTLYRFTMHQTLRRRQY